MSGWLTDPARSLLAPADAFRVTDASQATGTINFGM